MDIGYVRCVAFESLRVAYIYSPLVGDVNLRIMCLVPVLANFRDVRFTNVASEVKRRSLGLTTGRVHYISRPVFTSGVSFADSTSSYSSERIIKVSK